jgi:hypothetical protein
MRCKNGTRRNNKTGDCIRISQIVSHRCINGTRKNRKTGECQIKSEIKRVRCPNGSRKDVITKECEKMKLANKTMKIRSSRKVSSRKSSSRKSSTRKPSSRKSSIRKSSSSSLSFKMPVRQTPLSQRTPIDMSKPIDFGTSSLKNSTTPVQEIGVSLPAPDIVTIVEKDTTPKKSSSVSSLKKSSSVNKPIDFGTSSLSSKTKIATPIPVIESVIEPVKEKQSSNKLSDTLVLEEPIVFEKSSSKKSSSSKKPSSSKKSSSIKSSSIKLKPSLSFSNSSDSSSDSSDKESSDKKIPIVLKPTMVMSMKNAPTETTKRVNDQFILNRLKKNRGK